MISILTGRTKMQFSRMHSSMTLSEKHAIFAYTNECSIRSLEKKCILVVSI